MAQFAVHVAVGIYSGDLCKGSKALRYALIIGNFVPDFDFIPMLLVYPFHPELARTIHRSASHTLFLPLLITLIALGLYLVKRKHTFKDWGIGLSIGMVTHIVLDILFWFDKVKVFWPVDIWSVSSEINIWKNWTPPTSLVLLIRAAAEFLCYSVLFYILRRRAHRFQVDTGVTHKLRLIERIALWVFGLFAVLVFFIPQRNYEEFVYGLASFTFAPLTLYFLWKLRVAFTVSNGNIQINKSIDRTSVKS